MRRHRLQRRKRRAHSTQRFVGNFAEQKGIHSAMQSMTNDC